MGAESADADSVILSSKADGTFQGERGGAQSGRRWNFSAPRDEATAGRTLEPSSPTGNLIKTADCRAEHHRWKRDLADSGTQATMAGCFSPSFTLSPLGPPGRKDEGAQIAAEWVVTELGREICDHCSLDVRQSLRSPVHDGSVDGIAFD